MRSGESASDWVLFEEWRSDRVAIEASDNVNMRKHNGVIWCFCTRGKFHQLSPPQHTDRYGGTHSTLTEQTVTDKFTHKAY
ncbi:hypothetical protein FKM82_021777 [Ascaphus truei]